MEIGEENQIRLVQTSCGFAVPRYDYVEDRSTLDKWTDNKGEDGIEAFWRERNQTSLDGFPTNVL